MHLGINSTNLLNCVGVMNTILPPVCVFMIVLESAGDYEGHSI